MADPLNVSFTVNQFPVTLTVPQFQVVQSIPQFKVNVTLGGGGGSGSGSVQNVTSSLSGLTFGVSSTVNPILAVQNVTNATTQFLRADGTWQVPPTSAGTVSSVQLTAPVGFTVAGSPITTSGTLALTYDPSNKIPGTALGSGTPNSSNFLRGDGMWAIPQGAGTVTSVALTTPSPLQVAGSPVTTSGTLAISWGTGQIPVGNLGSGTASNSTYLRGDGTWQTITIPTAWTGTGNANFKSVYALPAVGGTQTGVFQQLGFSDLSGAPFLLTTSGTTGPATFGGGILNIPNYSTSSVRLQDLTDVSITEPTFVDSTLQVVNVSTTSNFDLIQVNRVIANEVKVNDLIRGTNVANAPVIEVNVILDNLIAIAPGQASSFGLTTGATVFKILDTSLGGSVLQFNALLNKWNAASALVNFDSPNYVQTPSGYSFVNVNPAQTSAIINSMVPSTVFTNGTKIIWTNYTNGQIYTVTSTSFSGGQTTVNFTPACTNNDTRSNAPISIITGTFKQNIVNDLALGTGLAGTIANRQLTLSAIGGGSWSSSTNINVGDIVIGIDGTSAAVNAGSTIVFDNSLITVLQFNTEIILSVQLSYSIGNQVSGKYGGVALNGIVTSSDGGYSWQYLTGGGYGNLSGSNSNWVFTSSVSANTVNVAASTDDLVTYSIIASPTNLTNGTSVSTAISGTNWILAANSSTSASNPVVFFNTNLNVTTPNSVPTSTIPANANLQWARASGNTFVVGNQINLNAYLSTNAGASWQGVNLPVAGNLTINNTTWLQSSVNALGVIYRSTNNGSTWTQSTITSPISIPNFRIRSLVYSGSTWYLSASDSIGTITVTYISNDDGVSFINQTVLPFDTIAGLATNGTTITLVGQGLSTQAIAFLRKNLYTTNSKAENLVACTLGTYRFLGGLPSLSGGGLWTRTA